MDANEARRLAQEVQERQVRRQAQAQRTWNKQTTQRALDVVERHIQVAVSRGECHTDIYYMSVPWRDSRLNVAGPYEPPLFIDTRDWVSGEANAPILCNAALAIWEGLVVWEWKGFRRQLYHHGYTLSPDKSLDELHQYSLRLVW